MAKLVVLITAKTQDGHRIGEVWKAAGAPGVTFVESYGLRRLQESARSAEILAGTLSMLEILRSNEETSLIVLSVTNNDADAERIVQATEALLGDMNEPDNGIVFVIDVERALGVRDHGKG